MIEEGSKSVLNDRVNEIRYELGYLIRKLVLPYTQKIDLYSNTGSCKVPTNMFNLYIHAMHKDVIILKITSKHQTICQSFSNSDFLIPISLQLNIVDLSRS